MPIVPLALLGALVYTFVNTLKFAQAKQWGAVLTQVTVWVGGCAAVFLVSASKIGETIKFTTGEGAEKHIYTLTALDTGSKLVIGVLASSLFASAFNQFLKSHDNNDTAAAPPLFDSLNKTPTAAPTPIPIDLNVDVTSTVEPEPEPQPEKAAAPVKKAAAKKAAAPRKRS